MPRWRPGSLRSTFAEKMTTSTGLSEGDATFMMESKEGRRRFVDFMKTIPEMMNPGVSIERNVLYDRIIVSVSGVYFLSIKIENNRRDEKITVSCKRDDAIFVYDITKSKPGIGESFVDGIVSTLRLCDKKTMIFILRRFFLCLVRYGRQRMHARAVFHMPHWLKLKHHSTYVNRRVR